MLISHIQALLKAHLQPDTATREYALIQLARTQLTEFPQQSLSDSFTLFRCHFLIRHCLYCLRNEWRLQHEAELTISPLFIEKTQWCEATPGIQPYDAVADFYLDVQNLERITPEEVSLLLNGFWDKFHANHAKQALCRLLNINIESSDQILQREWRRASMRLHPDKGGDIERFKQVQSAYDSWRRPRFAMR